MTDLIVSAIEGLPPEDLGYFTNRGLHDKPLKDALLVTAKAHREAESRLGVPANELIRIVKPEAPEADKKAMWQRLGAPLDAKDYDLAAVADADLQGVLRTASASANLPKEAAGIVAKAIAAHEAKKVTDTAAQAAAALTTEKEALAKSWGANADGNMIVAQNAVRALGIDPEAVTALEGKVGYAKVMEMFRTIGTKIGEDKFVGNPNVPGVLTLEQAKDRKATLMADSTFQVGWLAGDSAKVLEMSNLDKIIDGAK